MTSEPGQVLYEQAQELYERTVPLLMSGRLEEALPLCHAAVDAHRVLVARHPEYLLDFAIVLNNLATALQRTGRLHEAVAPLSEELGVRRQLAAGGDPEHRDQLARALAVTGVNFHATAGAGEGEPLIEESIRIRGELAAEDPERYRAGLGKSLVDLGQVRVMSERWEDAKAATSRALEILGPTAPGRPPVDLSSLAQAQHLHGLALARTDSVEAAIAQLEAAVNTFGRLSGEPRAVGCLMDYGRLLAEAGRVKDAAHALVTAAVLAQQHGLGDSVEAAVELLKQLHRATPDVVAEEWTRVTESKLPDWLRGEQPKKSRWRRRF